ILAVLFQRRIVHLLLIRAAGAAEVIPIARQSRDRFRSAAREPEWRMRLLDGFRHERDIAQAVEPAVERKSVFGPRPADDFRSFLEARAALLARDAEAGELGHAIALAQAEIETPVRDDIDGRGVFGHAQWIMERQQQDEGANTDAPGTRRDRARDRQQRGRIAVGNEVMLRQPYGVVTQFFSGDAKVEMLAIEIDERVAAEVRTAEGEQQSKIQQGGNEILSLGYNQRPTYTSSPRSARPRRRCRSARKRLCSHIQREAR